MKLMTVAMRWYDQELALGCLWVMTGAKLDMAVLPAGSRWEEQDTVGRNNLTRTL